MLFMHAVVGRVEQSETRQRLRPPDSAISIVELRHDGLTRPTGLPFFVALTSESTGPARLFAQAQWNDGLGMAVISACYAMERT